MLSSGEPYEGKPHVRFDEGSIGYQGDGLLERDTFPKGKKPSGLTWPVHHCTIDLLYSGFAAPSGTVGWARRWRWLTPRGYPVTSRCCGAKVKIGTGGIDVEQFRIRFRPAISHPRNSGRSSPANRLFDHSNSSTSNRAMAASYFQAKKTRSRKAVVAEAGMPAPSSARMRRPPRRTVCPCISAARGRRPRGCRPSSATRALVRFSLLDLRFTPPARSRRSGACSPTRPRFRSPTSPGSSGVVDHRLLLCDRPVGACAAACQEVTVRTGPKYARFPFTASGMKRSRWRK